VDARVGQVEAGRQADSRRAVTRAVPGGGVELESCNRQKRV